MGNEGRVCDRIMVEAMINTMKVSMGMAMATSTISTIHTIPFTVTTIISTEKRK